MKSWSGENLEPSDPKMLAAYLDGEFERCGLLDERKLAMESWLEEHPDAREKIAQWRRLKQVWQNAPVPEPNERAWSEMLDGIRSRLNRTEESNPRNGIAWGWWIGGAAAAVLLLISFGAHHFAFGPDNSSSRMANKNEVVNPLPTLPVVESNDVEILRIVGADTSAVVVGKLPVEGPIILAGAGEIQVTDVQSAEHNIIAKTQDGANTPMIWAGDGLDD